MLAEPLGLNAKQWQFLTNPEKYVRATKGTGRPLVLESTRRQFRTARDILTRLAGSNGCEARRGILLADDVGLGKTTVAALVAWVFAAAGKQRNVRILAPNDVMMRRWEEELKNHVEPLNLCARHLNVQKRHVKAGRVGKLSAGSIQVVKHSYASSDSILSCDLLIIDEAHRAKGEGSEFSKALMRQQKNAKRVLILTATPFSIQINELQRMLKLIGADQTFGPVKAFSRALDDLYSGNASRNGDVVAERLAKKAEDAVQALSTCVIRHGIDDLPAEHQSFGLRDEWDVQVPEATEDEVELILRMDRLLRIVKNESNVSVRSANDPRFHVGWKHFDMVRKDIKQKLDEIPQQARSAVECHLSRIASLRKKGGVHAKMAAVGNAVKTAVESGEKVILFCHHHATAQELTEYLATVLPKVVPPRVPALVDWRRAWNQVLEPAGETYRNEWQLRETFIEWLCADLVRSQTWGWITKQCKDTDLAENLRSALVRHKTSNITIAQAARALYKALLSSKSSRAVLLEAGESSRNLPGANGTSRILGVSKPDDDGGDTGLFIHNRQPDTIISIFNSPFGPDVLVVTDKLSEGIDLHRYCRYLIHYELDPSPIRTVQRNGRLRRVNCWAAVTGEPICYAYPAFRGTRDHRLVQIMKKRIDSFSLLLGGVQDFSVDDIVGSEESWRNTVIELAKKKLSKIASSLMAVDINN